MKSRLDGRGLGEFQRVGAFEDSHHMAWREYHEFTKHSVQSLRRTQHYLDWANMPDPFRHYDGVPILDLPADPPMPQARAIAVLRGRAGSTLAKDGAGFLSKLFVYSASISASKRVASTGDIYALRVNPSSGNLHPTEFHFCTRGLAEWPDGLYHYRASSHMAEQRGIGDFAGKLADTDDPLVFVLTSIAWREAWKYRERAYRYCLHDIGHAWESLSLSGRAAGCESSAAGHFADDEISRLSGSAPPLVGPPAAPSQWFGGDPNRLSEAPIVYPLIEGIHSAAKYITF